MANEDTTEERYLARESERQAAQREHQQRVGPDPEQVKADRVAAAKAKSGGVEETTLANESTGGSQG